MSKRLFLGTSDEAFLEYDNADDILKIGINKSGVDIDVLKIDYSMAAITITDAEVGDPGFEQGGINIGGVTYSTRLAVNDIGGSNPAQFVIHRHSTTLPAISVGSRSNSNTSGHAAVTNGMTLWQLYAAGYTGTEYNLFGAITLSADAGTISDSSSPGKMLLQVTPDGAVIPATAVTINEDKGIHFEGDVVIKATKTPSSASDTGTTGEIAWDSSYIYICIATNTWQRAAHATW